MHQVDIGELEKRLEKRVVVQVLQEVYDTFMRWNRGGALIHRVRAAGYLAETGARNIRDGRTTINANTTFGEMKSVDRVMYDGMLNFLLPVASSGIYSP